MPAEIIDGKRIAASMRLLQPRDCLLQQMLRTAVLALLFKNGSLREVPLPREVGWVTSQLVYDVASGTLGRDTAAQFGLWHLEPYSSDGGRTAVVRIRPASSGDLIGSIASETTSSGMDLSWVAEAYHYVVSCPSALAEDYCWQMAESVMPLGLLTRDA